MARIAGSIFLPRNKRIEIALTYIYGIGRKLGPSHLREGRHRGGHEDRSASRRPKSSGCARSSSASTRSRVTCGGRSRRTSRC